MSAAAARIDEHIVDHLSATVPIAVSTLAVTTSWEAARGGYGERARAVIAVHVPWLLIAHHARATGTQFSPRVVTTLLDLIKADQAVVGPRAVAPR